MATTLFVYLGIYIAVLVFLSIFLAGKESEEDFLIAGRDRSWWQILLSKYAASIGAAWFVAYTAFAYQYGLGVFGILFGVFVGFMFFALWGAPRIRKIAERNNFYTQGDFVLSTTKSLLAKRVINTLAVIGGALWLLVAIVGGAKLIEHLGLISYTGALGLTVVVVFSYLLVGGFKAVIYTDVLQAVILIGLLTAIGYGMLSVSNPLLLLSVETGSLGVAGIIGFLLFGGLSPFATPDRYQLAYAARDTKSLRRGLSLAFIPVLLSAIILLLIGLFVFTQNAGLDPGLVFSEALRLYLPSNLLPLGILLFFVALMSSADTTIYSMVSHAVLRDSRVRNKRRNIRRGLVTLAALSFLVGMVARDIIDLTLLAAASSFLTAIPMIYLIAGGRRPSVFLSSVAGGALGVAFGIMLMGLEPAAGVFAALGAFIGLGIAHTLFRNKSFGSN